MEQRDFDNFWQRTDKKDDFTCWLWKGYKDRQGYGAFDTTEKKAYKAHRFSAKYIAGMNIDNLFVCHRCDNPGCVNPSHLFTGTAKDNAIDKVQKNRQTKGDICANKGIKNPAAKINEIIVKDIRTRQFTQREYAEKYNLSISHIGDIQNYKVWKHL